MYEEVRAEHDELAVADHVDTVADTQEQEDQIGLLEGFRSRFGRTYAGEPDRIAEELAADEAVKAADTVLFTVPNQLGVAWCDAVDRSEGDHDGGRRDGTSRMMTR